jgi:hypothetical protein
MSVSKLNSMVPASFSSGEFKLPDIVGKPYGNVADAAAKVVAGMETAGDIFSKCGKVSGLPTSQTPSQKDVAQLDRAEALARDAFKRVMNPNANFVDKLEAQEEMREADKIRKQVEKHLDPLQRQAVEHINDEEKDAVKRAGNAPDNLGGLVQRAYAGKEMQEAGKESTSLDNWILHNPTRGRIETVR